MRARPSARRRSISSALRRWSAFGSRRRRPVRLLPRAAGSTGTSRVHNDTELRDTPSRSAMAGIVNPAARSARASSRSLVLPR